MSRRLTSFAWLAALLSLAAAPVPAARAEDVKVQVQANREQVYLGESILLTVRVSGSDAATPPDLSGIADSTVRLLGSQSQNYSNISIVNGRMTQDRFVGRIFQFEVTPTKAGAVRLGPIRVEAPGGPVAADGPVIRVDGIEQQDQVLLRVVPSKEAVLVDETFDVSVVVAIEKMPGAYRDTDPINPAEPPLLSIPFLDAEPPAGLQAPDVRQLLQGLLAQNRSVPGFAINNFTISNSPFPGGPFGMFGFEQREEPARFRPERRSVQHNGREYWEYTLRVTYTAREEKSHTFGPVLFKGTALAGVDAGGYPVGRRVFAVGPACTVRVIPPPEEGRPASFIGAIGTNLQVEAALDAQTCRVGDPLSLTLTVSGGISLDNLVPPNLGAQSNLVHLFRVYGDSVKTVKKDGLRQFVYTVRPIEAGTYELPPIEVSYFDAQARAYRTAYSRALPVRAAAAAEVGNGTIIDPVADRKRQEPENGKARAAGLAPMTLDPAGATPQPFRPRPWHAAAAAGGPLLCAAFAGYRFLRRSAAARAASRRQRSALHRALHLLESAAAAAGAPTSASAAICAAMRQYLADRLGLSAGGLTPEDARRVLPAQCKDAELAERFCALLERNFNRVYAGGPGGADAQDGERKECRDLLHKLDRALGPQRRTPSAAASRSGMLLLALAAAGAARADDAAERTFMWNEANTRLAAAATPADFLRAAAGYRALVDRGVRNAPLFYNLGTALLRAGQHEQALAALLRAERYEGTTPEIRANLLLAMQGKSTDTNVSLPWYRVPLFWHYELPWPMRLTVAVLAFAACWVAGLLRMAGWRQLASHILAMAIALLVLFGSSVITSWQLEARADADAGALPPAAGGIQASAQTGGKP